MPLCSILQRMLPNKYKIAKKCSEIPVFSLALAKKYDVNGQFDNNIKKFFY